MRVHGERQRRGEIFDGPSAHLMRAQFIRQLRVMAETRSDQRRIPRVICRFPFGSLNRIRLRASASERFFSSCWNSAFLRPF